MIKMNMARAIGALLMITGFGSAHSTLIQETWESTITYSSNSAFAVGDTFMWSVTYDDASLIGHIYWDAENGIAEHGTGDDAIWYTYCTGAAAGSAGCTDNFNHYSIFADASFDLSGYYNVMTNAGLTGRDVNYLNDAWYLENASLNMHELQIVQDDMMFDCHGGVGACDGGAKTYFGTGNSYAATTFSSKVVSSKPVSSTQAPVPVPEPASIALMGLGLAGLGMSRRRQKKAMIA